MDFAQTQLFWPFLELSDQDFSDYFEFTLDLNRSQIYEPDNFPEDELDLTNSTDSIEFIECDWGITFDDDPDIPSA